jgi:hypothetical protein
MRRIALSAGAAAALMLTAGAAPAWSYTPCSDVLVKQPHPPHYLAQDLREKGFGCEYARRFVHHVLAEGTASFHHIHCNGHKDPHDRRYWSCDGRTAEGVWLHVSFYSRPYPSRAG